MKVSVLTRSARGQTLVEFAVASAVFFMIIFGILQFGLAVWNYNMLPSLAQDGARYAAVHGDTNATACTTIAQKECETTSTLVQDFVRSRVVGMTPTAVTVTTTYPDGDNSVGDTVQVQVDYTFSAFTTIVRTGTLTLHGVAQMKIAR